MIRNVLLTVPLIFLAMFSAAQNAPASGMSTSQDQPQGAPNSAGAAESKVRIPSGTVFLAELSKSVDAKKVKVGDKVEAKTTRDALSRGQVLVPRNSRITGHVTEVKFRTKDSKDSMVEIVFDHLAIKGGGELPVAYIIQAIGRPMGFVGDSAVATNVAPSSSTLGPPASPGTSSSRPTASSGGPQENPQTPSSGDTAGSALSPNSEGAVGLRGLSLTSSEQGSVISSNNVNVHLDGGAQLVLRVK